MQGDVHGLIPLNDGTRAQSINLLVRTIKEKFTIYEHIITMFPQSVFGTISLPIKINKILTYNSVLTV